MMYGSFLVQSVEFPRLPEFGGETHHKTAKFPQSSHLVKGVRHKKRRYICDKLPIINSPRLAL